MAQLWHHKAPFTCRTQVSLGIGLPLKTTLAAASGSVAEV